MPEMTSHESPGDTERTRFGALCCNDYSCIANAPSSQSGAVFSKGSAIFQAIASLHPVHKRQNEVKKVITLQQVICSILPLATASPAF
jgi:hypothetical protein